MSQDRRWQEPPRTETLERLRRLLLEKDLPPSPDVLPVLLETLAGEPDVRRVVHVLERDPSLVVRVLGLANSAFLGARGPVTTVSQAITLLGFTTLRDVAIGFCVWHRMSSTTPAFRRHRRQLWTHAASVAAASRYLARLAKQDPGPAFAAGLLHDIGKLVFGYRLDDRYWILLENAVRHGQSTASIEREAFGCDHATVGGWLAEKWQLPATLVDAIAMHHDPLPPGLALDVPGLVATANRLINATDPRSGALAPEAAEEVAATVPVLGAGEWQEAYAEIGAAAGSVSGIFDA